MTQNGYLADFTAAVTSVIGQMAMTETRPGEPYTKTSRRAFGDVTGLIGMASPRTAGMMCLSFQQSAILGIFTNMLGESVSDINEEVIDAVGEFTNMICGDAKRRFAEHGIKFDMATPIVVVGQEVYIRDRASKTTTVLPFDTDYGSFVLESNIFD